MLYIADNRKMHYVTIIKSDCIMSKLPHMPDINYQYTCGKGIEKYSNIIYIFKHCKYTTEILHHTYRVIIIELNK